jgi:hypothetical protein
MLLRKTPMTFAALAAEAGTVCRLDQISRAPGELGEARGGFIMRKIFQRVAFVSLLPGTTQRALVRSWDDMDFNSRQARIPTTKAGQSHLLPLPNAAVEILKALPRSSEYVFPGTAASGHLTEPAKVWQRIRKRAYVRDARIHDLRRTLGWRLKGIAFR